VLLSASDARLIANDIAGGFPLSDALGIIDREKRPKVLQLADQAELRYDSERLLSVLHGIEGARSILTTTDAIWTMPGHNARNGELTSSLTRLVANAKQSIICSTYNFQKTSGMWNALRDATNRPGVTIKIYLDSSVNIESNGTSATETATWLAPAKVFVSNKFEGRALRNHAKYLVVDHRFVVVTSANFSWSAEQRNIELGVRIDDPNLADRIEHEMRAAEESLFTQVPAENPLNQR
jgi:phosphatidylserine/phosphatidylglycerophosphate/cardiolipin synthase-like enzyme